MRGFAKERRSPIAEVAVYKIEPLIRIFSDGYKMLTFVKNEQFSASDHGPRQCDDLPFTN